VVTSQAFFTAMTEKVLNCLTESHVSHLRMISEEEINRLLGMVVDVENLYTCVHKEEDVDTKQVYFYLFKVSARLVFFLLSFQYEFIVEMYFVHIQYCLYLQ
jgi:PCAF (P300/CBP-associated factor) N-terminal domain